ncbi:MAG: hypothetical protein QM607_00475 [Microbacterium sp.]
MPDACTIGRCASWWRRLFSDASIASSASSTWAQKGRMVGSGSQKQACCQWKRVTGQRQLTAHSTLRTFPSGCTGSPS